MFYRISALESEVTCGKSAPRTGTWKGCNCKSSVLLGSASSVAIRANCRPSFLAWFLLANLTLLQVPNSCRHPTSPPSGPLVIVVTCHDGAAPASKRNAGYLTTCPDGSEGYCPLSLSMNVVFVESVMTHFMKEIPNKIKKSDRNKESTDAHDLLCISPTLHGRGMVCHGAFRRDFTSTRL